VCSRPALYSTTFENWSFEVLERLKMTKKNGPVFFCSAIQCDLALGSSSWSFHIRAVFSLGLVLIGLSLVRNIMRRVVVSIGDMNYLATTVYDRRNVQLKNEILEWTLKTVNFHWNFVSINVNNINFILNGVIHMASQVYKSTWWITIGDIPTPVCESIRWYANTQVFKSVWS